MYLKRLAPCAAAVVLLSGCGSGEVSTYEIPKEAPPAQAMPGMDSANPHAGMAMSQPSVTWSSVPAGWSLGTQSSSMRLATFTIEGESEESAEMAIIPMSGFSGPEEQLVNMWRMQLGLPELAEAEAEEQGKALSIGNVEGRVYEMSGTTQGAPSRILVASVKHDDVNYFFKLIGHDALVTAQKDVFLSFVGAVQFEAVAPDAAAPPAADAEVSTEPARWSDPENWEKLPATQFLLAKYRVSGEGGASAQVTVSQLGGSAGGLLPNVNRWRGQLSLAPVDEAGMKPLLSEVQAGSIDATLVTLESPDQKMLTVVVSLPSETWFFKMTGPASLVDARTGEFRAFVNAARF